MNIDRNDTSFPTQNGSPGLTKREYFAALAMQGEIASGATDFTTIHADHIAEIALACADGLINALNKPQS